MTDRKLFEQALEALKLAYAGIDAITVHGKAITALEQRLAQPEQEHIIDCPRCGHCCPQQPERVNQCAETCERAKLCATCARALDEQPEQKPVVWVRPEIHPVMELRSKLRFRRMFRMR